MSKDLAATLGMDLASESSKPGIAGLTSLHEVSFPNEALWCSECDSNTVLPGKSETGAFFSIFGTAWDGKRLTEHNQVVVAYCDACLKRIGYR